MQARRSFRPDSQPQCWRGPIKAMTDENANKPEKPKVPRNRGRDVVAATRRKIAAMAGAGMTDKDIAKKVGRVRESISWIRREIIPSDPELVRIREEARARVAPRAIAVLEKNLETINAALDGVKVVVGKNKDGTVQTETLPPPLSHQASALRELAALSGLTRDPAGGGGGGGGGPTHVPMTPEAIAALIEAVKKHQAEQTQPRDITAEGERIE